jgi:hypothetical protein
LINIQGDSKFQSELRNYNTNKKEFILMSRNEDRNSIDQGDMYRTCSIDTTKHLKNLGGDTKKVDVIRALRPSHVDKLSN